MADVDIKAAEKTAEDIRTKGVKSKAYKADVTKKEDILRLREDSRNDLGTIDILVSTTSLHADFVQASLRQPTMKVVFLFYIVYSVVVIFEGQQCRVDVEQKFRGKS